MKIAVDDQHDEQRQVRGGAVPDGERRMRIDGRGQDEREHRQADGRDHPGDAELGPQQRPDLAPGRRPAGGQPSAKEAQDRREDDPGTLGIGGKPAGRAHDLEMQRVRRAIGDTVADKAHNPRSRRPARARPARKPAWSRAPATGADAARASCTRRLRTSAPARPRHASPASTATPRRPAARRGSAGRGTSRSCRRRSVCRSSVKWNGTPCSTLPTATPKISAGTAPPTNSAQSQPSRQRGVVALGAVLERHRPHDEGRQDHEHRQVEAREADRVKRRPGGEDRAAAEDEPDLVAFPDRADGVDDDAAFDIGLADEGQQARRRPCRSRRSGRSRSAGRPASPTR